MLRKVRTYATGAIELAGGACLSDLDRSTLSFLRKILRAITSVGARVSGIDRSTIELSTSDTSTTNLCGASATAIPWNLTRHGNDQFYRHSTQTTDKTKVYVLRSGLYSVRAMISYSRQGTSYVKPLVRIRVNGATTQALAYGGPLIAGTNGDKSTCYIGCSIRLVAGDYVEVTSEAAQAQQATYNTASGDSIFTIQKVG